MEGLLDQLHTAGYEIHALSNYPPWYQIIETKLGLSRYLKWSFVSCRTGVRKPHPEAFSLPPKDLNRPPSEFLFIDDVAENCEQARQTGMRAIHFRGHDDLVHRLREKGTQLF